MPRPLRLICVEDCADDAELTLRELRRGGFEPDAIRVETADALRQALQWTDWDAVVSDYRLPSFDAHGALALVQASGQDLPFVVVTGTIGEERAVELMRAGAHDFVLKGQLGRLAVAVERAIGDARVRFERARALDMLQTTNQELATLVEAAPLAICAVDARGIVRSWNPAAARLLGWPAGDIVGRELPPFDPGPDGPFAAMGREARAGRTLTAVDGSLRCRDGRAIDVSLSLAPLETTGGYLMIAEDIRTRRQLEANLLQSQKMEAVGMLAGGVAHDFNNILGVILGFGEQLTRSLPADDRRRRAAEQVCRAADRASALTRQLLAFSRKQVQRIEVVDIGGVVRQMEPMLRRLIGENIALQVDLMPVPVPVSCDQNQIEMVLMNLVVNARDAMPAGGALRIATAAADVAAGDPLIAQGIRPGRHLVLGIADTGMGMDAATRARIFEPFFTTKERGRGTGLGLASAFGIVKQSNGCIAVESEPGRGTTFRIYLPLAAARDVAPEPRGGEPGMGGGETILVVEDEDGLRQLIRECLEGSGYRVVAEPSAEAALARGAGGVDLLLTDIVLPGMNGVELAHALRASRPELQVLYMSGYTGDAIRRQGLTTADVDWLEKPFRPAALIARIQQHLARRPAADRRARSAAAEP